MQEIKKGWKKVKLGEISEFCSRGISPKYSDFGISVINQKCIRDNKIDFSLSRCHNIDKKFSEDKLIKKYDILINSTGVGTLGRVSQVKENINNFTVDSHVTILRLDSSVSKEFVGYVLINLQEIIEGLGKGATGQIELSRDDVKKIEILLPPLPTQQKIASILSKYDDLIENNNKRIKILEETVQSIYEEWFVKYNFPGSENIKMIDSGNDDFGMIPEGWEVKKVGELLEKITRKQKIKTTEYLEKGSYPIIDQGREFIAGFTNDEKLVEKDLLPMVIFGDHTRILKYVDFPFVCGADGTQLLFPKNQKLLPVYFYMAIKNIDLGNFHYARHFKFLKEEYIIIPGDEILEKFNNNLKDNFKLSEELRKQNQILKETRDLLIPRLVSGELDVESLDVNI